MGMTIDDADTILSCERLDSSMGCGASDEDIDEALGVAIDTMRKYQKIQEIINNKEDAEILKDISNRLEEVMSLALRVKHKTGNIDKLIDKLDVLIPIYENYRNKVENYDAVD